MNISITNRCPDLPLPERATAHAAGFDLRAAVDAPITLKTLERALVPTGLSVAIPPGFEGQVRPRSGLAVKNGIGVVNAPGTIDADYRGEIAVILINFGSDPVVISRGDRIAQLVISPIATCDLTLVEELPPTERGSGGFGSTGV